MNLNWEIGHAWVFFSHKGEKLTIIKKFQGQHSSETKYHQKTNICVLTWMKAENFQKICILEIQN